MLFLSLRQFFFVIFVRFFLFVRLPTKRVKASMNVEQFKSIILRHQPAMQRMAESLLHDEADAADAVQETFIQLWQQRKELDEVASTEAYCIAMVRCRCIDLLRKRHRVIPVDMQLSDSATEDTEERYRKAIEMVYRLPQQQRQTILMKYEELMSSEEIAHRLGITLSNLYTTLSRAYASLRDMLEKE